MTDIDRRSLLISGASGAALLTGASVTSEKTNAGSPASPSETAHAFGLVGDGAADDTAGIEALLKAVFDGDGAGLHTLPPGRYRITRPIRIETVERPDGNITQHAGLRGYGAQILSEIESGEPVFDIAIHATIRFMIFEGIHIKGGGGEGAGLAISCQHRGTYFYNFCIRDMIVESCGGDGCRLIGNIFETQIFNSYFRDNGRDGAYLGHGAENTVLSAMHVFGCVFGGNRRNGVSLADGAADLSFHGCYFLLNGHFGLSASTGVTLLSHCGFENNHERASDFSQGDAGLRLLVGGTLIGCTAYSIRYQTHLVRAYVTNRLLMLGCRGRGGEDASAAALAKLNGRQGASLTLIGCEGGIDEEGDIEPTTL